MTVDRRDFLKKSAALGLGAGVLFLPKGLRTPLSRAFAAEESIRPDLVALKGGSPEAMFDRGIGSLGGMGRFVKKGQTVLLKPNMSWDVSAADGGAANTSPGLVARVVRHCLDAGAKRVIVMDHSIEHWERSYKNSGIGDAVRASGATYAPAESERYYQGVEVKGARTLRRTQIHEAVLESDVLISVPVLKHHGGAGVSISAKGLMGCVWDRYAWHGAGLQQCIADFLGARKPDLNVIDAYRVVARNGPRGGSPGDVAAMNSLILSPDVVAADTAASMMLGHRAGGIEHIRLAGAAGFGQMDLSKLKIERITL